MSSSPAKKPVAAPATATVGVIAALAMTVLGAVAIREALVDAGAIDGAPWLGWLLGKAEVLRPAEWMTYAGAAAMVIGLWILVAALKPRRATHWAVGDPTTGVWIRRADAARLATDTARGIDSVTGADTKVKGRRFQVAATVTGDANRVREELAAAIGQRLQTVTPSPRVRARVTVEEL